MIDQTWSIFYDRFPSESKDLWWDGVRDGPISELSKPINKIELPFGVMQSVTSFTTYQDDDTPIIFPASEYQADTVGPFGRIALRLGAVWPQTVLRPVNGIEIQAVFGFGSTAAAVPQAIQTAVLEMLSALYEYRGDEFPKIPASAMVLIQPYRRHKLG